MQCSEVQCSAHQRERKKRERWQISSLMRDETKLNGKWIEKKVTSHHRTISVYDSSSIHGVYHTIPYSPPQPLPPHFSVEQSPLILSLTTRALTSNIIWCLKVAMALWNPNSYSSSTDPLGRTFARTGGAGCVVSSV
jgi:hypothetical protein